MTRILVVLILGAASAFWLVPPTRLIEVPFAALTLLLALISLQRRSIWRWALIASAATIVVTFLPVDISLLNVPRPPGFVPLEMGLPGPELAERCARGEAVCGSCILSGSEPRWLWVW